MEKDSKKEFVPPRHWIGPEELDPSYWSDPKIQEKRGQEFYDKPIETLDLIEKMDTQGLARRDFLTIMGASMAMAATACARRPVTKIIPYVVQPEELTPGVANFYASADPGTGYGLLVKTREGRPIKLEGNPKHPLNRGALGQMTQASVLSLYDPERLQAPAKRSRGGALSRVDYKGLDSEISAKLKGANSVRVMTPVLVGDSSRRLIGEFLSAFPRGEHIEYDPLRPDDVMDGQELSYGTAVMPTYRFDRARVVVSLGADFLGTWGSPIEYARDWVKTRKLSSEKHQNAEMSKLFVFEPGMSVTGANADFRTAVRSGDELNVALAIAHELIVTRKRTRYAGDGAVMRALESYKPETVAADAGIPVESIRNAAEALWSARGRSLVVAGGLQARSRGATALQVVVNLLNSGLENDGVTVDGQTDALPRVGGGFADVLALVQDMNAGRVDVLILDQVNPLYSLPASIGFADAMKKVKTVIAVADRDDETALYADYLIPACHFLEAWGDAHPRKSIYSVQQPTIMPLFASRTLADNIFAWSRVGGLRLRGLAGKILSSPAPDPTKSLYPPSGSPVITPEQKAFAASAPHGYSDWQNYVIENWRENIYPKAGRGMGFEAFWDETLRNGLVDLMRDREGARSGGRGFRTAALSKVPEFKAAPAGEIRLALYETCKARDGSMANNAWLQEMPDPISTVAWDNFVNVGPTLAKKMNLHSNDVVEVTVDGAKFELPAFVQPGVHPGSLTVAVGYGRTRAGKVGTGVGVSMYPLVKVEGKSLAFSGQVATIRKTGAVYRLAETQWHGASENRPIINDITLAQFRKNPESHDETNPELRMETVPTIWPKHPYPGHRWGMAIDLTSCIGCGSCVIACQAENNVPVVGRANVRKSREMQWLRIDRYYSGSPENPNIVFEPMLCQQCENAPCETVCPVLATVHSDEGLNQMVYNRCVGTRYCQNNCPYKVRRFNFFDMWKAYDSTQNLVWNPDVTVRSRGVMEKCTFCVQRINDAKGRAKVAGVKLKDGELQTACQQTCPTDAIVFGDINDPNSRVSKLQKEKHSFRVLETLNTRPQIAYLTKVRNKEGAENG